MTTPPSTRLNCAGADCEHCVVPTSATRRSQDWTGHRLGGIKPGGPVNPHQNTTPLRRFFQLAQVVRLPANGDRSSKGFDSCLIWAASELASSHQSALPSETSGSSPSA